MAYSKAVASAITAYFNEQGLTYELDEDKGFMESAFTLDNKLEGYKQRILLLEKEYLVWSVVGFVEERYRREVAKFIARVNYTYTVGYLTINMESGQVTHCYHEYFKNRILSEAVIGHGLIIGGKCLMDYGNALYAVMNGELSAKAAFDTVKKG